LFGVIVRTQYICNVLGVSRSPVSEATAQLENEKNEISPKPTYLNLDTT